MPTTVEEFRSIRDTRHEGVIAGDLDKPMNKYADSAIQHAPALLWSPLALWTP